MIPKSRTLSVFVLAMLNVSVMASLRNLPLVAEYGLGAICYFLTVALLFLVPCALISAELATGWPKLGGIYVWVKEAFGERWAFLAVWVQWAHNLSWYPVILSFVSTILLEVFFPAYAHHKHLILWMIISSFWGMTLLNYLGIKTSSLFSTFGVIAGTIVPGLLIIALGIIFITSGNPAQTELSWNALIPEPREASHLVFLAGMFLAFAGLEVTAAHAANVINPQRNFPRAIAIAALITFTLFMLGSLAIAVVVPKDQISLVSGLIEAFSLFFSHFHLNWILPIITVLLAIGAIAEVNAWIIGPVKGLYATSEDGLLPPIFHNKNKHGAPTHLLLFQAIIVTLAALVFLEMPTLSASFWILTALSAQSYLIMYILMFLAAVRLRYSKPGVARPYRVPFGNVGIWVLAILGSLASLFAIIIGFVPPAQINTGSFIFYELVLTVGLFVMCIIPLVIYQFRKKHWVKDGS